MQNFTGTIDYDSNQFKQINFIKSTIKKYALRLNLQEIDTPIIEYKKLLLNKYSNELENKEIFNLENCMASLRYDLTVPLIRYVLNNGIDNIRRFQIGKVFRKDAPYPQSGRFCEFYQADIDIVGEYNELESEIEIFWLIDKILKELNLNDYIIKYNYRQNLEKICNKINVTDKKKIKNICITIDKLDKKDWDEITKELTEVRKLSIEQINNLKLLLNQNYLDESLYKTNQKLVKYVNNDKFKFESTLARGLDYYTGIIYEVVIPNSKIKTIIAGGRYDKLIYNTSKKGKKYLPAIGISFGISRINCILPEIQINDYDKLFLICTDYDMRIKLSSLFRNKNFIVNTNNYKNNNKKTIKLITFAVKNNYDFVVIYGENDNKIKLKNIKNKNLDKIFSYEQIIKMNKKELFN